MIAAAALREALSSAEATLAAAGCESPRLDAELLLGEALGVDRAFLYVHRDEELPREARRRFAELLARREAREPVAYILGRRAFRHIELLVDRRVLIPRPETELLVEVAIELPRGARIHDVGTGSGAVALAVKDERPDLVVSASDVSPEAVDVARANAQRLRLDVPVTLADGLPAGDYDLVVANLPYVTAAEWDDLPAEIRLYEPRAALVGGEDGLDPIRAVTARSAQRFAVEHGTEQGDAVRALLSDAVTRRDLGGHERVTVGTAR